MRHVFCILAFLVSITGLPGISRSDHSNEALSAGASMRIASLPVDGEGKIEALLDIQLKPDWITYWREPGAAGIPPQLSLQDASLGTVGNIRFPVPKALMLGNYLDIAYDEPVQIPFTISLNDSMRQEPFTVSVLIGVCKDICIPFTHDFTVNPQAGPHTIEIAQLVASAQAKLPEAPSDDFKVESFEINDDRTSIDLSLTVPAGTKDLSQVIIAGPAGHAFTKVNESKIDGTKATLNVDAASLPKDYLEASQTWTAVFSIGARTMESELKFPAS